MSLAQKKLSVNFLRLEYPKGSLINAVPVFSIGGDLGGTLINEAKGTLNQPHILLCLTYTHETQQKGYILVIKKLALWIWN